ncbi:phytanoyl-CoA dioxygenase family protein [Thalassobaculum salexigens]|uniref:phytanoyl-CoA dioxygenase family protein n=1 Tax=Thalassobaculum salexigens TaxID=455360 RepID=UPI0004242BB0|nr:phytanoyl-CoA dioxygenase family protein [Thalassobaculum salexigens]
MIPRFAVDSDPAELAAAYGRDGVLVVEDAIPSADCDALIERAHAIVDAWDPADGRSVFSTTAPRHASDAYFRGSGDKIRVFLEEGAVDAEGALTVDRHRAVNKLGHAMHDLDPDFDRVSRRPVLARIAAALGIGAPKLVQSMVIWKPPAIGGAVVPHQDAAFLVTDPPSVTGFWLALEDADEGNGCLIAQPGGHRGPLRQRFLDRDGGLSLETLDATPYLADGFVPLPARKGTLVVLHGLLPHGSAANTSPRSRMAYTLHVVDGAAAWHPGNWIRRRPNDPFLGF